MVERIAETVEEAPGQQAQKEEGASPCDEAPDIKLRIGLFRAAVPSWSGWNRAGQSCGIRKSLPVASR
jgi:hypothetical protein